MEPEPKRRCVSRKKQTLADEIRCGARPMPPLRNCVVCSLESTLSNTAVVKGPTTGLVLFVNKCAKCRYAAAKPLLKDKYFLESLHAKAIARTKKRMITQNGNHGDKEHAGESQTKADMVDQQVNRFVPTLGDLRECSTTHTHCAYCNHELVYTANSVWTASVDRVDLDKFYYVDKTQNEINYTISCVMCNLLRGTLTATQLNQLLLLLSKAISSCNILPEPASTISDQHLLIAIARSRLSICTSVQIDEFFEYLGRPLYL